MAIPDIFRAAEFIRELREFEKTGKFPNLVIICLPNDHTSGTSPGFPTPAAQVADNDLAFGQIVEAISHSLSGAKPASSRSRMTRRPVGTTSAATVPPPTSSAPTQEKGKGLDSIQPNQFASDDGVDSRDAADESLRRQRHTNVRLLHRQDRPDALRIRPQ